jgi:aspartate racemase
MELGTVNPFLIEFNSPNAYLHVFDEGLLVPFSKYPATVMTNAGEKTWAIEFDPLFFINHIQNKKVISFSVLENDLPAWEFYTGPKSIGIITGNGPDSGMTLWNNINLHIKNVWGKHFLGDISFPRVHVVSMPSMGLSMELDKRQTATWQTIEQAIEYLLCQNIEILTLACHTTHYFTEEIKEKLENTTCTFISMPEVVVNYIYDRGIENLAILGINYVADLEKWSAYSQLKEITIESLKPETIQKLHELGYNVKMKENFPANFQKLKTLITDEVKSDNVLIALTELSILLEKQGSKHYRSKKNVIDALDLYSKKIAEESLGINGQEKNVYYVKHQ